MVSFMFSRVFLLTGSLVAVTMPPTGSIMVNGESHDVINWVYYGQW